MVLVNLGTTAVGTAGDKCLGPGNAECLELAKHCYKHCLLATKGAVNEIETVRGLTALRMNALYLTCIQSRSELLDFALWYLVEQVDCVVHGKITPNQYPRNATLH